MNENLEVAAVFEASPLHIEVPQKGQCTMSLEHHPAIMGLEQKQNLVNNICEQPLESDRFIETMKEENNLLKAKLKGFEALAYLYQLSKNECASLKKLCAELSKEKEEYRKMCLRSDNELHSTPISLDIIERNVFEATDVFRISGEVTELNSDAFRISGDGTKLNSDAVGIQTANQSVAALLHSEEYRLSGDEYSRKLEELVEFSSGEFKKAVVVGNRSADDENQSSYSLLEIQSSVASSEDGYENKIHDETHDLEILTSENDRTKELSCSGELSAFHRHLMNQKVSMESKCFLRQLLSVGLKLINLEEQMQVEETFKRGAMLSESPRLRQMESSATQTLDQVETIRSDQSQSCDHGTEPEVDRFTGSSLSSEQRKSLIVTDDLITEVQILRQQVMTFKDDFERERRDREKVRSEYDLLKFHFDNISVESRHLKDQLRSTEIKLEESEREKAALRHNITKTAQELRKLKKASSFTSSRTVPSTQRVPPLEVRQTWPCVHCTYLNPYPRQTCEMCGHAMARRFPLQAQ